MVRAAYSQKWVLLLWVVSSCMFVVRGPVRALRDSGLNDLLPPLTQSAAWLHGADPYGPQSLARFWPKGAETTKPSAHEIEDGSVLIQRGIPTAYPPTCLVLLAPFSLLPWAVVDILWIVISVGLFFTAVRLLASRSDLSPLQRQIFVIATLLLAPFHTGISTRNISVVAIECGVIGIVLAMEESQSLTSGGLIALSAMLKPQIGFVFVVCCLIRKIWRVFGVASGLCSIIAAIALLRMTHVRWLASYLADKLLSAGILGDFTE